MKKIVLASTSKYRCEQLKTLGLPFVSVKPVFDEDLYKNDYITSLKNPHTIAARLSHEKGASIASTDIITISADQLVALDGQILGKPGSREKSIQQIQLLQNKTHELVTACTVFNGLVPFELLNVTQITFKPLTMKQIEYYVDLDQPWDCAGSFKIEKHGIQLIEAIKTNDFTAIQGLPLLSLSKVLNSISVSIPFLEGSL